MKSRSCVILSLLALAGFVTAAGAHTSYIGYSGAPGTGGRCASSCHGSGGGTIVVSGFPTQYTPGQVYTINITHNGGSMIKQFNGSCRIGTGSQNAGVIASGNNTVTYNTGGETNGVHLVTIDTMGGDFLWTAPPAGTGDVTLYVAGHQGDYSGANTNIVLTATEEVSAAPGALTAAAPGRLVLDNQPNPLRSETTITYVLPQAAPARLEIYDPAGRLVEARRIEGSTGLHQFVWNASALPPGLYLCRIQAGPLEGVRKMIVAR